MVFIHSKNQHTFQSSRREKSRGLKEGRSFFYSEQVSTCIHSFLNALFSHPLVCNSPGKKTKEAHADMKREMRTWRREMLMKGNENPYYKKLKRHDVKSVNHVKKRDGFFSIWKLQTIFVFKFNHFNTQQLFNPSSKCSLLEILWDNDDPRRVSRVSTIFSNTFQSIKKNEKLSSKKLLWN